ncbi:MAG: TIGR04013 family B12-binding domain/radical SAM domain-containing protein [candidate division WOR-3 bacterium]
MKIAFRITEDNRYSFIPIFDTLKRIDEKVELFTVFDLIKEKELIENIDILMFSFTSLGIFEVFRDINLIKSFKRKPLLIAGGPHVSALPHWALDVGFDVVVVGEAEAVLSELIRDYAAGNLKKVYKGKSVVPIYSFRFSPYVAPIEIVRGCPYGCKFCQVSFLFGRTERFRPFESVIDEAKELLRRGRDFVRFIAPNALSYYAEGKVPNVALLSELFVRLREAGIKKIYFGSFPSEIRPEYVTESVASLLRDYVDNRFIAIGVQTGSDRLLSAIGRGHTIEDVKSAVSILNRYGFTVILDFLFGLPEEHDEDIAETFSFIEYVLKSYKVKIRAHFFIPLPGTPYGRTPPRRIPKWALSRIGELARYGVLSGYWYKQSREAFRLWEILLRYQR